MKVRLIALLTTLLLLGTACSTPAPPTPPAVTAPAGACSPDEPTGAQAIVEGGNAYIGGRIAAVGGVCAANTYVTPVTVTFRLPAGTAEAAVRSRLKVEGAAYTLEYRSNEDYAWAWVRLAAGAPGDQVKVSLTGQTELGFHLSRRAAPAVSAEVMDGSGQWVPLPAGSTLPRGRLHLRFGLSGEPSVAELKKRIAGAVKNPAEIRQVAPDLIETEVEEPYPQLFFNFQGVSSRSGLEVQELGAVVYTGKAPQLVSLDVRTGQEEVIAEVPPDIQGSQLALDPSSYRQDVFVVDTTKGTVSRVQAKGAWPFTMSAHFAGGRVLFPAWLKIVTYDLQTGRTEEKSSAGRQWGAFSPDGRYLFGFTPDYGAGGADHLAPVDIVLYDTTTGTEQVVKHAVRIVRPFHDPAWLDHGWTPDGLLVLPDVLEANDNRIPTRQRTVRLDPATGLITPTTQPPVAYAGRDPWVAEATGRAFDSQRSWGWEEVTVRSPDGTIKTWGKGKALGWTPEGRLLVVRWENAQYRREPPGL